MIIIKETNKKNLPDLMSMWNDGEVMYYVGFPNGLGMTEEKIDAWLDAINKKSDTKHYSITDREAGFLGETFYSFESLEKPATLDIKLIKSARNKQVARLALSFAIDQLFKNTNAILACVDPNIANFPAQKLYEKLGFVEKEIRKFNGTDYRYMEIKKSDWQASRIGAINFRGITYDNFLEACFLQVKDEQKDFIATNSFSLAQSKYQDECIPKAIYSGINMVGFLMYCVDRIDHEYWVYRLMIDQRYQGLGYGKKAMELILEQLIPLSEKKLIRISFEPENIIAKTLYENLGFRSSGLMDGGEIVYERKDE